MLSADFGGSGVAGGKPARAVNPLGQNRRHHAGFHSVPLLSVWHIHDADMLHRLLTRFQITSNFFD